jgi:hypothetical protein
MIILDVYVFNLWFHGYFDTYLAEIDKKKKRYTMSVKDIWYQDVNFSLN